MSVAPVSTWPESRIERALLWFLRIILLFLLASALLRQAFQEAMIVAAILGIHSVVYLAAGRAEPTARNLWAVTLVDIVLASLALYLTGGLAGQAGILGFCLAAVLAARLSLWQALVVNSLLWLLFTLPFLQAWLGEGESFSLHIVGSFVAYWLVTFALNYLVSMEARQVRMGQDAARRLRRLMTVHEVGRTISSTLDLEAVLDLVMTKAVEILDAEAGSLLLLEGEPGELVFRVVLGPAAPSLLGQRLPPGKGIAGAVLEAGEGLFANDVQTDAHWYAAPDIATGFETRSVLCAPLISRGRAIGVLEVINKKDDSPFDDEDLELLGAFAVQAAIALENARLYDETNRRLQQVDTLYQVGRSLATLDMDRVLSTIAEQTVAALDVDVCGVFLHEQDASREGWTVLKALHDPSGLAVGLLGNRFSVQEHTRLRDLIREAGYAAIEAVETDERLDEALRQMLMMLGIRSCLFVGLYIHAEPRGFIIAAERRATRAFSPEDIEFCQALAHQAIIAVENASLYERTGEALNRRLRELATIEEIDHELGASLDYDRIINLVLERAIQACNANSGLIGVLSPDRQRLDVRYRRREQAGAASDLDVREWPLERGIIGLVVRSGQPALIDDVGAEVDYERVAPTTRSEVAVPIKREGRVIGVLNLESDRLAAFSDDDLHFLEHLADHAGIAIENARLYEQTDERLQARVDELTALQRTTQELNATLALDSILPVVLDSALQTTGASYGNVMLMDLDTGRLTLRAARGYTEEEQAVIEEMLLQPSSDNIAFQVAASGQPRIVDDAQQEPHPVCVRTDTRSALVTPIFYQGDVVGLINLRHTQVRAFDQEDLTFVQALASQAAVAIGNAMRYEEQVRANTALRRRAEQMTSLLAVGRKLRADVPLEETLEEIAYAIQETVGFNTVLISVVEDWQSALPPSQRLLRRAAAAGLPLDVFEEAKKVRQPLERYERILREEYRRGACYFFPFQKRDDWAAELHTLTPMPEIEEWQEGQWHPKDMLLIPLRGAGGRLLGHISVDEPRDGRRPSRQTLEVLAIFANQAAVAVENAGLYAAAQRRADVLALINKAGRDLTQILEPAQVLDTVVRAVTELLQCEMSAVFQPRRFDGKLTATASYGVDLTTMGDLCFAPEEGLVGAVAATKQPLLVPDTSQEPRLVEGPAPIGSMMLVPMMVGRQVIGVLTAGFAQKRALTQADQVLLTTLADQAAVALENARLFAGMQQAALRLGLLNEIGRRAAAQLALQEMLETTVEDLHQILGYHRVAVLLVDQDTQELYVAAANKDFWPLIPPNYRQKIGQGVIGAAAAAGETVLTNDAFSDERFRRQIEWEAPASVSVPIKAAGQVIGVLEVQAERPWAFSEEEDAAALEIAADQLAAAIQNARLFQETQRRVAELATINQIGRAISGALDVEQLAELIYSQVSHLLDSRNFHIALYEPETEMIHIEFVVEHGQRHEPVYLKLGQGLTSYLLRTGQPILLTHGVEGFIAEHGLTLEGEPAKSWLGVPMIAEDRVIGTIAVQSYERENAFDEGHLELLTTIAGQAAVAFQNAFLFQERQRRIEHLAVVNEMARAISSTLELDDLLEAVYRQVSRILDTSNFYIALYDPEARDGQGEITFPFVVDPEGREDWSPRPGGVGLTGRIIETGEPLLLPTGAAGLQREAGREYQAGFCRSWLGVPMIAEGKVLGVIAVQSYDREYVYDQEDLDLLSTIAAQAATAVRNAQLYRQIVRFGSEQEEMVRARTRALEKAMTELTAQRDRAETLYRITSELGATLELERVLQRALRLFADAMGIEHGTILLLDQESGYLYLRASLETDRRLPPKGIRTSWKRGVGLAGWVLEHREPVLVADISQDPRWTRRSDQDSGIRSVVAAPLTLGGGDILGVLTLGHVQAGYFTPEHLQLVTAAAAQVAIAVSNSDLYAYITEQAEQVGAMLQAQREEAAKNLAILESIADGVLVLDHNGRVLLVNPAAEELLGFAAMAIEGEHFRHILGLGETPTHRELAQLLYSELRQRLEEGDRARLSAGPVRLESGKRVLAVNIAPLIVAAGDVPGLVAALRDISREAEVERLKNEFISTVSHELRTPMTSIKGYTDLLFLGMAGGLTDEQRNFLQIIKSNADRLTALVNDILDIARIETGRVRLTIEPLNLGDIISQVVASFREQFREKGLILQWQEPPSLPKVRGDMVRVTQVLNNLIANAWQYTPGGGRVTVSVHSLDRFLQVDVADTGIGIAPDDLARVFDRFFRADDPLVQEAGGTGLGLSIVKMFVEMLGGGIWVESELGVGSTFSFTLPLASEAAAVVPEGPAELAEALVTTELPTPVGRRSKILVVEDDRELALLLRRQLELEGYQVLLTGSGEDALWLAREEQPQLILLDIMLPDVDGFSVLGRLKDHPVTAPIPVVVLSVLPEADKGYALGAVDYVVKPFEEEKLLDSIRQALSPLDGDKPHRLLVVDDDLDILVFLEQALSFHGYQVRTASGGRQALAQVQASRPDLILLDLRMPDLDGYEVIRRLKSDEATRSIPIIVITASPVDKERDRVQVLALGAAQYMTKPLSIETLIREIKQAIMEKQPV